MNRRRSVLTRLGASLAVAALFRPKRTHARGESEERERIAILGTGRMGTVLGKGWGAAGHAVIYGSRTPTDVRVRDLVRETGPRASATTLKDAAARAGVLLFAVPWEPLKDLVPTLGDLGGKTIIDPTIYVARSQQERDRSVVACNPASLAEQLQSWVPGAKVVKAFNTIAAKSIANPRRAGGPVSIPLAGDDVAAKTRVAGLVSELEGLEPLDCGPLRGARHIESLLFLARNYSISNPGKRIELYFRSRPVQDVG